jgi:PiT family inorganic phosphate transporter
VTPILIAVVLLTLVFAFLNGVHDSSNVVATMISSRAFSPRVALGVTAAANFLGPFIFGVAVADTIGNDVVDPKTVSVAIILAALLSANLWDIATWILGLPSSSSHALVGGIVGAVIMGAGWQEIHLQGLWKVLIPLFTSPLIGFVVGYILLKLILFMSWDATTGINNFFKRSQILTGTALALSHGTNDSQKAMGILALALVAGGVLKVFEIPTWVIIVCATMISLGTAIGGWRLIRTLGGKFYKIRPIDGFTSQLSSSLVIIVASLLGGPVSTTQVVSSAIMGTGTAERANKVRWNVAEEIGVAWLLTIPASAAVAAAVYWILSRFVG